MSLIIRLLYFLLMVFLGKFAYAQVPFASVSQAPLLLNPAVAGGRDKIRIASIVNSYASAAEKEKNLYASYDQMLGNTGIGLGAYYHYRNHMAQPLSEFLKSNGDVPSLNDYSSRQSAHSIGFVMAPKYNIKSKKKPGLTLFSLSPALFFDYQYRNAAEDNHFEIVTYKQYTSTNPDGLKLRDEFYQFVQQSVRSNVYRLGLGLHLNASHWIVLGKVSYEIERAKEEVVRFVKSDNGYKQQGYQLKQGLYAVEESLNLGFSFPKRKETLLSFTPLIGIGCKQYINLKPASTQVASDIYSLNLSIKQRSAISYLHTSGTLRVKKIIGGVAYTKCFDRAYYGPNIGFQSSKLKIIYSLVLGKFTFNEISMVFVI